MSDKSEEKTSKVWEWPLRLWHWLLAISVVVALFTALATELDLMTVHTWAGMSVFALLVFRFIWGIWGGTYARFRWYWTTPKKFIAHFRGKGTQAAHTSPGIVLAVFLFFALLAQSGAGLFMTDDVFTDGPLVQFASDETIDFASFVHHRAWWFVLGLAVIHVTAHFIYAVVLKNPLPMSMFSGNKHIDIETTRYSNFNALVIYAIAVGVWALLFYYSR